jgi:hypothetical protein
LIITCYVFLSDTFSHYLVAVTDFQLDTRGTFNDIEGIEKLKNTIANVNREEGTFFYLFFLIEYFLTSSKSASGQTSATNNKHKFNTYN